MSKVCIYARTNKNSKEQLQSQISKVVEALKGEGISEYEVYADEASAMAFRPSFEELLIALEKGEFNIVAVASFDRIARKTSDFYEFKYMLEQHNARLYIVGQGFYNDEENELAFAIQSILANNLAITRSRRAKAAWARKKAKELK
jgi:DNA invertase Pin-like site-specific DNA recombinase